MPAATTPMSVNYTWSPDIPDHDLSAEVAERLAQGQVGVVPTETVPGIVCLYTDDAARERIYHMKGRDRTKQLQVLVGDVTQLQSLNIPSSAPLQALAKRWWPGRLTVVVSDAHGAEHGIRIPDHPLVSDILKRLGQPLAATSANLSGESPATSWAAGFADLAEPPDFIVMAETRPGPPSTVVRLRPGSLELLRQGAIPFDDLEATVAPHLSPSAP